MLRNYLITALRNLLRNRTNTTINVLGLTLGLSAALVLFLVIRYELSFNKHFGGSENVYRIVTETNNDLGINKSASLQFPFLKAFQTEFPDIPVTYVENDLSAPTIYVNVGGDQVRFEESSSNTAMVSPDYPTVFGHDWIYGDPATALAEVNSVVLTRKMALKYFGRVDVLNETLGFNNEATLKITGVIEDYPNTTDLPIDVLISIATHKLYDGEEGTQWGSISSRINCYIKLPGAISAANLEDRLKGFDEKYSNRSNPEYYTRLLQPLTEVHFATGMSNYGGRTISRSNLWSMGIIGALLLVIACSNFVNLNTALALRRSKEVGIRKVLGGNKKQLFFQFMGETFLVTFLALALSMGAAELALVNVREYLDYDLHLGLFENMEVMLFLGLVFLVTVLLSGLYPAVILSSYQPIAAIRNKAQAETKGSVSLRKTLVALQLSISQALIICTILVIRQMDHFYNTPIGLDKEAVIEISVPSGEPEKHQLFKTRALEIPGVQNLTFTNTGAISGSIWAGGFDIEVAGEWTKSHSHVKFIDKDFLDTYGVKLLIGENVQEKDSARNFLVNERLLKKLGYENNADILGTAIDVWGNRGFVSGVVADYNTQSLHESLKPLVMVYDKGYEESALRFNTADTKSMLAALKVVYEEVFPDRNFQPNFLEETIANFYEEEQKASALFQIAAGVAIFIGCIGMLGLISYIASRRIKEVGIRKVLGASVANILLLFSRQFLTLTLTGFVLAAPVAYYLMNSWLQNYEYRIQIGVGTFILGLLFTVILVITSVGFRAYHSATINPARSLRSE